MLPSSSAADLVRTLVLELFVMVLSLTVHECAHAWVARRLGDDTAERQGRISLSPVTHVDPIGTLLIPALGIVMGGGFGFIGWARPTPVNPARFRRDVSMRTGMAIVAIAGPLSNLALALASLGAIGVMRRAGVGLADAAGRASGVGVLVVTLFLVNTGLATFNLLPLPPLDGSRLLPRTFDALVASISRWSFVILMVLLNVSALRRIFLDLPFFSMVRLLQWVTGVTVLGGV